ncbi:MAG: MBL fold metallo-hydrolase [Oscillospiraceae bacterium]|nr:MBL fold metallo-hydrolase [Oscillospiraceae bacterium]
MAHLEHKITEIAPKIWCISEYKLVNAFAIEGETGLVLIDATCGIGNLKETVRKISCKPVTILLTHDHFDHNGGIYNFPEAEIFMHPDDDGLSRSMMGMSPDGTYNGLRDFYIRTRGPVRCPEYAVEDLLALIPPENPRWEFSYAPVNHGDVITAGGRKLKVIHTPGHTDGSVCYLDSESGILFSGDTVNNSIILMRQPGNDMKLVKRFNETVKRLWELNTEYDVLAIGHDGTLMDKGIVKDYLDLTEGLLKGTITGEYQETGFRKGDVARLGKAELWYQCDA